MKSTKRDAVAGWCVLTTLNLIDLLLYIESMKYDIKEVWVFKSAPSVTIVIMIKLMMPVIVAHILLAQPDSRKIIKVLWYLCAIYAFVVLWNILQFVLL